MELIVNGSGSYMELRKAYVTVDHVKSATLKVGRSAVKYSKVNRTAYYSYWRIEVNQCRIFCLPVCYPKFKD